MADGRGIATVSYQDLLAVSCQLIQRIAHMHFPDPCADGAGFDGDQVMPFGAVPAALCRSISSANLVALYAP